MEGRSAEQRTYRSYENRTRLTPTLPPAANRGIVRHRHAAGAFVTLELPFGRAQRISIGAWAACLETRPLASVSCLCAVLIREPTCRPGGLRRGRHAVGVAS